ncbi:MAG TPA: hypothetical protein VNJ01_17640 [Bacteriovoracaceae bacterium]|nr:hypothetical protein [Bacteriovoracaceae bacterium]
MNYQEQFSNVFGKIKGTFEIIKKSLEREEAKDKLEASESQTPAADHSMDVDSTSTKNKPKRAKKVAKDFPRMNARNQSMKASSGETSHKGSSYGGKGSINTDAAVFDKNIRGRRDGKK